VATGRNNQLTRQIGEHLVVAELGRMGFIATPFAGNVPNFDLLVANEEGFAIPVQVKTINGGAWQFAITTFLDVQILNGRQKVLGRRVVPHPNLVCVLVVLRGAGEDEFYTLKFKHLQDHFGCTYKARKPPHKVESMHCAVWAKDLHKYKGWSVLLKALKKTEVDVRGHERNNVEKTA
jgi:hypothetical protein